MSQVNDLIKTAITNLQQIVDANTIIGNPITVPGGTTIIPVSKVAIGIASGGIDYSTEKNIGNQNFGGGNGAGVSVSPVAFLVVSENGDVKILNMSVSETSGTIGSIDNLISKTPDIISKIKDIFTADNKEKTTEE